MSDVVIKVENLWKEYRLGTVSHHSMAKDLQSWWARMRGKEDPNAIVGSLSSPPTIHPTQGEVADRFWALQDVSFEVKRGDLVGIIGRNGAGKSTLLKILSKVTTPTKGQVTYKGRIASLLEVGTGFHPELTGRENIFLNGAILGMSKDEIKRKFDEIVDFAEVEKFIDTPVKRYSSGMYVRLAFGVAAHLEPEILIVDEVLAVGDAKFQQKCLGKMGDVSGEGRTVLYVSHSMNTIQQLCNRAIVLNSGKNIYDGNVEQGVKIYLDNIQEGETFIDCTQIERMKHLRSNRDVSFISIEVVDKSECVFGRDEKIKLRVKWRYATDIVGLCARFEVRFTDDSSIGTSFIDRFDSGKSGEIHTGIFEWDISSLAPGNYKSVLVLYSLNDFGNYYDHDAIWPGITFKKEQHFKSIECNWNHWGWGHVMMPNIVFEKIRLERE